MTAQEIEIHAVEGVTGNASFEDALDRVYTLLREFVDLLTRLFLRVRNPQKLGVEAGARDLTSYPSLWTFLIA